MKWFTIKVIGILVIGFFAPNYRVFGATDEIYRFRPGIHLSRESQFKNKQLETLLQGFRFWTGFCEIEIDRHGNLVLSNRSRFNGGSGTARELIISAVDSSDSFTLVSRDNSPTVAFAQIESTDSFFSRQGGRHSRWELRLDFSDFNQLSGADDARHAFDPAINVIHELVHAVRGYLDNINSSDRLGDCERYVNTMRAELGLPQRAFYYPRYIVATKPDGLTFVQGELRFIDTNSDRDKSRELYVTFNVDKIFDRSNARSKADVLATLLARKHLRK